MRKITLSAGSQTYSGIAHGFGNPHLIAGLIDSSGQVIAARIDIDSTNVTVNFARATDRSYTLMLVGSDQTDAIP